MQLSSLHIVTKSRIALAIVLALVCTNGAVDTLAQLPVRAREVRLLSNNNTNYVRLQAPNGMVADWTLLPPLTVGTSNSIPVSTVTGSSSQLNWLAPGANGTVLSIVAGAPTYTSLDPVAWLLVGNSGAIASSFVGPTTASIPLNFATANATPGSMNWYLGTVAAANLRMSLSTASGFQIGNATNAVNTSVTGTLSSTGTTTLASAASSNVAILNAATPGTFTVNGTALTPNVTMTSLGGVAKATVPVGYDRIVLANSTGSLDEASLSAIVSAAGWALIGNSITAAWTGAAGSFLGTTNAQPLSIATTNITPQDIAFYSGIAGVSKRMEIDGATGFVGIGNITPATSMDVDGGLVMRPGANVLVTANGQTVVPGNRSYIVLDPGGVARVGLILANGLQIGQILVLRIIETAAQPVTLPDAAANNVDLTGNWVGAANDIISLIWTGVDWVETSRSNN